MPCRTVIGEFLNVNCQDYEELEQTLGMFCASYIQHCFELQVLLIHAMPRVFVEARVFSNQILCYCSCVKYNDAPLLGCIRLKGMRMIASITSKWAFANMNW